MSDELRGSEDITLKQISKVFDNLRVARNQADYDGEFDSSHFEKFLHDYEKDLEIAFSTINYLKSHPNY